MIWVTLGCIVAFAFTVETIAGFGATVISVSLAANLMPLDELLPIVVPLNVALSAYLVGRHARHVDRGVLVRRFLPSFGLGMPIGLALFNLLPAVALKLLLGAFLCIFAPLELRRLTRPGGEDAKPVDGVAQAALLGAAGVIHGALSTGGPLVVYWAGRAILDKSVFRATLSALWLATGLVLVANYAATGLVTGATLARSAMLFVSVFVGIGAGEWLHARVSERRFRVLAYALLLLTGITLVVTNI
ncbi:MAG: sulfite exporter TauE/SafE family protein [Deltaproteobacteria bacterium]|nr:sulfite exporter TauE/SafE family protein [Deltaproteobacteria bacterium]